MLRTLQVNMKRSSHLPSASLVRFAFFGALVLWTLFAGKDVSWDVVNHQFYLPFSWISGRFRTDLFGAGPQSYQNPLGYFPVYALVRAGLPAWSIGVLLGALHALAVWPLDRIARIFWPRRDDEDFWLRALALAFCCITPVFLMHVGSTSIDPITNLLVLWAVALSLEPTQAETIGGRAAFLAGTCLGLASALKLSNAPFAIAVGVLWLLKWACGQRTFAQAATFGAALCASFAVAAGPWMWWLWQDFGNPIFPLYNNVFHSPYAPPQAITALRFVPETWGGAVSRLWELAELSNFVSMEAFLPDVRLLLAAVAAVAVALTLALRGGWQRLGSLDVWRTPGAQLALVLALNYVLWIRTSGNARYGLPMFVLVGIGLVRAVQLVMPLRAAKVALLTALLLQAAFYGHEGSYRFKAFRWDSGPYLEYRVPARLVAQPFLHLSMESQTDAAVALFLNPHGALANVNGQLSLPTDGPLGARLEALLAKWHGRTRVLMPGVHPANAAEAEHLHDGTRALLYRLGIDVDWQDCEPVERVEASSDPLARRELSSCAILERPQRDPVIESQLADANRVFFILEKACPKIFVPTPFASEHGIGIWQRHYMNTEAVLSVSIKEGVSYSHFRAINVISFGTIEDVLQHRRPITCPQLSYQTPK